MEFRILGPLQVLREGRVVALGGAKPRAVLAVLLLQANRPVGAERLAAALWGDDAPAGAVRTVQVHVSRLRRALDDDDLLATTPAGYRLRVRPGELDLNRFERLLGEARRLLAPAAPGGVTDDGRSEREEDPPRRAISALEEALSLWRGPPLADLAYEPFAQPEIARLEDLQLTAMELLIDAKLALGRHAEVVAELERLVADHPYRERLRGQLMLALYRCDRQADALRAYHALDWSLENGDPALALRMAGLLAMFWENSGRDIEGLEWIDAALDMVDADAVPIADRARALRARVHLDEEALSLTGDALEQARAKAAEALALSRRTGDPAAIADALLGLATLDDRERFPQAGRRALAEEALTLAREADEARLVALALAQRALALPPQQAQPELEQAASALRAIGNTRILAVLYSDAAYNALKTQHLEIARSLLDQAVPLAGEPEHRVPLAYLCGNRGLEALFTGDFERAGDAFREELQLSQEHVLPRPAAEGLAGLAAIASRRGQLKRAAQVLGAAAAQAPIADPDVTAQLEEQFFGPARAAYGERRWSEAEAEGERLNLNQAIALALTPNRTLG